MAEANAAIGIFDSGVGGLTVARAIMEILPAEPIVYLGDTARVPYGTKSGDTVVRYARACAAVLLKRSVKLVVVACNTASAFAIEILRKELDLPVVDVVEPGAAEAVLQSRTNRIGVIGTSGTIQSRAYEKRIHALAPDAQVFVKACPLFVPLAEEGWTSGPVPEAVAREYLEPLLDENVDTLVLGCTHYPLLRDVIEECAGPSVTVVDSASATARAVSAVIAERNLACTAPANGRSTLFLVSDGPESFSRVGRRFMGHDLTNVEWVDF